MSDKNSKCKSITELLESNTVMVILIIIAIIVMMNDPPQTFDGGSNSEGFEMIGGFNSLETLSQDINLNFENLNIPESINKFMN
tara:strand:- start:395 stop:646 length:252 start_codon:yes stop_codon:yes gene_type:complete